MKYLGSLTAIISTCLFSANVYADDHVGNWSVVPTVGASFMSDQNTSAQGTDEFDGPLNVQLDDGFTAGLGLRYRYGSHWESEISWEYRSNDSSVLDSSGNALPEGNYASNIFFINGRRYFDTESGWSPFVGAGVQWVQEVDIDLEDADGERSYSDSGAFGFQLMAGVERKLTNRIALTGEIRYGSITGIELEGETIDGTIGKIDYQPVTALVGAAWRF